MLDHREELDALARLQPRRRSECAPVRMALYANLPEDDPVRLIAPCPYLRCRYHLHSDVDREGVLRLFELDMDKTCALDVVDAAPEALSREQIATVIGLSQERSRILERRIEEKVSSMPMASALAAELAELEPRAD